MKLFNNKYNQSQIWLKAFKIREDKKQILQEVEKTEIKIQELKTLNQQQVVFTYADKGHNEEEAKKIQGLYAELQGAYVFNY